ncbi:hypothetical protein JC881_29160 [Variovorax sp. IB41]|nr:O-methyltransferase [Variovorax sp. IB41]MBJ2159879.1 hypothetical protein [Variovorax sp. IB41]
MISIENTNEPSTRQRFDFNIPYRHVKMQYGLSTHVLARLDWHQRTVLWLDYDGNLDQTVLTDIETVCIKAKPGSAIFVSVNANPPVEHDEEGKQLPVMDALKSRVGDELIPLDTKPNDLSGWNTARVYRTIIQTKIEETLRKFNGVRPAGSRLVYRQLANFHYEDGARMLTVGGVLFEADQEHHFSRCDFQKLPFVAQGADSYLIDPPFLTFKEVRAIDASIPLAEADYGNLSIPRADVEKYMKVYRYFPNFIESEV